LQINVTFATLYTSKIAQKNMTAKICLGFMVFLLLFSSCKHQVIDFAPTILANNFVCYGNEWVVNAQSNTTTSDYTLYLVLTTTDGQIVALKLVSNETAIFETQQQGEYQLYACYLKHRAKITDLPQIGANINLQKSNCYIIILTEKTVIWNDEIQPLAATLTNHQSATPFSYYTDTLIIANGAKPYHFDWIINGYVRHDITDTQTGAIAIVYYSNEATWQVTVASDNVCGTDTLLFKSSTNALLHIDSYTIAPVVTNNDGSISLNVMGGDLSCGVYQYQWQSTETWTGTYAPTGSNSYILNNLPHGWYSVTVTDCVGDSVEGWYWVG
jgi:hypothetical protein